MITPVSQTTYIPKYLPKKVESVGKEKKEKRSYKGKSFKDILTKEVGNHTLDIEA
jgi:hypothetical protein